MGVLKTTKLDNGMVGFECIYGGKEAPFGGIDASNLNPRDIDPRCFVDASNFLLISGELCSCFTSNQNQWYFGTPPNTPSDWFPWPMLPSSASPGVLLGVGRLPCENVTKIWALFVSPSHDSSNYWHYRIVLWTFDGILGTDPWAAPVVESYDCVVPVLNIAVPAINAQATILVSYNSSFTANQSVPDIHLDYDDGSSSTPPYSYGNALYEVCKWNYAINGLPAGGTPYANSIFANSYAPAGCAPHGGGFICCNTPSTGVPDCIPNPAGVAYGIAYQINNSGAYPFTATIDSGNPNLIHLKARTLAGYGSVDGTKGNALNLSGGVNTQEYGYYPQTTGLSFIILSPVVPIPPLNVKHCTTPSPFTQPSFQISVSTFTGGVDGSTYQQKPIQNLTYETVGNRLFLAGWPANYMLEYNDKTKYFGYLTQYEGARVLRKLAGHLISVGLIPGIDHNQNTVNFDNPQLWFSWSAPGGQYSQWESLDSSGLVTGAGGAQLGDISDQLTGLVVSNSVAFILRAEGLSYASVLQGSSLPFDFNHVALCKDGQGCQSTALWTQFDQLGFYIGQTNVFMLQQSPQAIGDKILTSLFPQLMAMSTRLTDTEVPPWNSFERAGAPPPFQDKYYNKVNIEPLTFVSNQRESTQFAINLAGIIYMYDPQAGTWMKLNMGPTLPGETTSTTDPNAVTWSILKCVSLPFWCTTGYDGSYQTKRAMVYAQRIKNSTTEYLAPEIYDLTPSYYQTTIQEGHIWFPAEEISFGRDITIDALYVLAAGAPGLVINFQIDGWQRDQSGASSFVSAAFTGSLTIGQGYPFPAGATDETKYLGRNYEEYQVFDITGKAITMKAPQLKVRVLPQPSWAQLYPYVEYPPGSYPYYKIAKIAMFGSFDPNQRPV